MKLVYAFRWLAYFANTAAWGLGMSVFILTSVLGALHAEPIVIPQFLVMVALMETLGVFIFVAGLVGCLGHVRVHRPTLKAFLILGTIVLLAVVAFAGYLFTRINASQILEESHWWTLGNTIIDDIQAKYECCGYQGPADFTTNPMRLSCFHSAINGHNLVLTSYDRGCFSRLEDLFLVVWAMCIVLVGAGLPTLALGLLGTLCLEHHLRRQKQREEERFKSAEKAMKNIALKRNKKLRLTPVERT